MRSLEACYEINFSKVNFIERKFKIKNSKTIITGASKTGKSYLIYDFLSEFKAKEYLYIDFSDLRNDVMGISLNLEKFIRMNEIIVLVLENFDFDLTCNLIDFEVVRAPRKGDPIVLKNAGVRFSQEVQQLIQLARPGDRYYFNSIKTKCPGDMANREIGSLEFVIE